MKTEKQIVKLVIHFDDGEVETATTDFIFSYRHNDDMKVGGNGTNKTFMNLFEGINMMMRERLNEMLIDLLLGNDEDDEEDLGKMFDRLMRMRDTLRR